MGTVRKTITFTEQQDQWMKAKIAGGQFTNDSEYIRDLVRRDQEKNAEIEAIRAALIEGEEPSVCSAQDAHRTLAATLAVAEAAATARPVQLSD